MMMLMNKQPSLQKRLHRRPNQVEHDSQRLH